MSYDQFAVDNNFVAVAPIHFDLTDNDTYNEMGGWNIQDIKI